MSIAAPLAREVGGLGRCKQPTYKDTADPDYQALLGQLKAALQRAWASPRRDLGALKDEGKLGLLPRR